MRPPPLRPPCLRPGWLLLGRPLLTPRTYMPRRIATTSAANAAPVDLPPLVLNPGSAHHDSLSSFLDYAKRVNLTPDKTTYVGTHYEYITALALQRLGFSLLRVGGAYDAGIDLIGHWVLAPLPEPLPVILQCKARKITLNPAHVRELEGSFAGIPSKWREKNVLGLLVTSRRASKGMLEAIGHSRWPMGFVLVSREGLIEQFVWNRAASACGLEGVGVTVRHTPRVLLDSTDPLSHEEEADEETVGSTSAPSTKTYERNQDSPPAGTLKDIQLTWMGSPVFPASQDFNLATKKLMQHIVPGDTAHSNPATTRDQRVIPRTGGSRLKYLANGPGPCGGEVGKKRGRPFSNTMTPKPCPTTRSNKKRAQESLSGAKIGEGVISLPVRRVVKKKLGRPKGSKNKPQIPG